MIPATKRRAGSSCCRCTSTGAATRAGTTCPIRSSARAYEQVLREGNDDDIRYFIDVDQLQALWTRLWLARRVCAAWAAWFRRHRGVSLPC